MSSSGRDPVLEDGLTCFVCFDSYSEGERRPLMLPACGHTFCRQCLAGIMTKERSNFLCPTCRRSQPVHAVQDLPVNYSLLDVIRRNVVSPISSPSRQPQCEACSEHQARLAFWCLTCEVALCGECLFERHAGPNHDVVRIQEQMASMKETVKIKASRVVTQLVEIAEENITEVKMAFLSLVEHLRQRRAIDKLLREARQARARAWDAGDLGGVTAAHRAIVGVKGEFERAQIATPTRVALANPMCKEPDGPRDEASTAPADGPSSAPADGPSSAPADGPSSAPASPTTPAGDAPPAQQGSRSRSTQTAVPWVGRPGEMVEWESVVCGVLSGSWTSSKVTLEARGLHVYSLKPMKEKCDLFLNLSVVSAAVPLESPVVFLDLEDECRSLGRVYITLQIHFLRAQQFFSLCLGDRGPSFKGSCFHSVLRKGNAGEGLAGGDYEGKAGKGGAAIMDCIVGQREVPKRCERGMVIAGSTRPETGAQFCISVKDGPRSKTVFPFGRVCHGLGVVEAACRRPAFSVSVTDCGVVLPL